MSRQELPESDHVVHYVPDRLIGERNNLDPAAFMLRPADMKYDPSGVSVNWLEFTGSSSKDEQLAQIREWSTLTLRKSGRFAELNVGNVLGMINAELDCAKIVHDPKEDPSHSLILGLPTPEEPDFSEDIGLIIVDCVLELHPGKL